MRKGPFEFFSPMLSLLGIRRLLSLVNVTSWAVVEKSILKVKRVPGMTLTWNIFSCQS